MSVPPNVLICETDFPALGIQPGEELATVMRIASTLTALTVASAWSFKKISRLRLFFAHWLSGLMLELGLLVENMMVTLCWTSSNLTGLIKTIKYVELAAGNMLAFTNLAICVNLTFVVLSHRRTSRVKGTTSPPLIGLSLVISMGLAAIAIPFWEGVGVLASGFWIYNTDEGEAKFIVASLWYVEFFIGVCMLFIVTWLVVYRMVEIKHCWKLHVGIRYYFGLTILATIVNLSLGICGSIFLTNGDSWLLVWSNVFRYIHIALDTLVLYGVLRMRGIDERTEGGASSALPSRAPPGVSVAPLAAHAV